MEEKFFYLHNQVVTTLTMLSINVWTNISKSSGSSIEFNLLAVDDSSVDSGVGLLASSGLLDSMFYILWSKKKWWREKFENEWDSKQCSWGRPPNKAIQRLNFHCSTVNQEYGIVPTCSVYWIRCYGIVGFRFRCSLFVWEFLIGSGWPPQTILNFWILNFVCKTVGLCRYLVGTPSYFNLKYDPPSSTLFQDW